LQELGDLGVIFHADGKVEDRNLFSCDVGHDVGCHCDGNAEVEEVEAGGQVGMLEDWSICEVRQTIKVLGHVA
jgi:hypothetical protein